MIKCTLIMLTGVSLCAQEGLLVCNTRIYQKTGMSHHQIYLMNLDGSGRRQLTRDSTDKGSVAISADGKSVAYVETSDQSRAIVILETKSGKESSRYPLKEKCWITRIKWLRNTVKADVQFEETRLTCEIDIATGKATSTRAVKECAFCGLHEPVIENGIDSICRTADGERTMKLTLKPESEHDCGGSPEAITFTRKGGGVVRVVPPPDSCEVLSEFRWNVSGSKAIAVFMDHGASSWNTNAYVVDVQTGKWFGKCDSVEEARWISNRDAYIGRRGCKMTKEFQEAKRKIEVWANDLVVVDAVSGEPMPLIPEVSLTYDYDFTVEDAKSAERRGEEPARRR